MFFYDLYIRGCLDLCFVKTRFHKTVFGLTTFNPTNLGFSKTSCSEIKKSEFGGFS